MIYVLQLYQMYPANITYIRCRKTRKQIKNTGYAKNTATAILAAVPAF